MNLLTMPLLAAFLLLAQDVSMQLPPLPTPTPTPDELAGWIKAFQIASQQSEQTAAAFQNNMAGAIILLVGIMTVALIGLLIFLWKMTGNGRRVNKDVETTEAKTESITAETFNQAFKVYNAMLESSERRIEAAEKQREIEHRQHIESLQAIGDAHNRTVDRLDAIEKKGSEPLRDLIKKANEIDEEVDNLQLAIVTNHADVINALGLLSDKLRDIEAKIAQKCEDTGKLPPITQLDADEPPEKKTA